MGRSSIADLERSVSALLADLRIAASQARAAAELAHAAAQQLSAAAAQRMEETQRADD